MNALDVTQRQLDAYNAHDPDALIALYTEGATYHSPRSDHPLKGQALADFFKSLFTAFPDMRLEVISSGDTGGGLVASQWVLHGTHTGPYMDGTPPTGRTIDYPLASFAQIESDKIRSQDIYLDRQTIAEQLGLKPKKNETTAITEEKKTPCELKNTKGMAVGKDRPERCSPDEHGRPMRLHSPSKARRARGGCATQNVKAYWAQQMSIYTREISEAV